MFGRAEDQTYDARGQPRAGPQSAVCQATPQGPTHNTPMLHLADILVHDQKDRLQMRFHGFDKGNVTECVLGVSMPIHGGLLREGCPSGTSGGGTTNARRTLVDHLPLGIKPSCVAAHVICLYQEPAQPWLLNGHIPSDLTEFDALHGGFIRMRFQLTELVYGEVNVVIAVFAEIADGTLGTEQCAPQRGVRVAARERDSEQRRSVTHWQDPVGFQRDVNVELAQTVPFIIGVGRQL